MHSVVEQFRWPFAPTCPGQLAEARDIVDECRQTLIHPHGLRSSRTFHASHAADFSHSQHPFSASHAPDFSALRKAAVGGRKTPSHAWLGETRLARSGDQATFRARLADPKNRFRASRAAPARAKPGLAAACLWLVADPLKPRVKRGVRSRYIIIIQEPQRIFCQPPARWL